MEFQCGKVIKFESDNEMKAVNATEWYNLNCLNGELYYICFTRIKNSSKIGLSLLYQYQQSSMKSIIKMFLKLYLSLLLLSLLFFCTIRKIFAYLLLST